ncbi:MAG TPA: hypothetical protein VK211_26705 [Kamptonema sp.]|nr:hypothetical protein [Kamptonema sp.]
MAIESLWAGNFPQFHFVQYSPRQMPLQSAWLSVESRSRSSSPFLSPTNQVLSVKKKYLVDSHSEQKPCRDGADAPPQAWCGLLGQFKRTASIDNQTNLASSLNSYAICGVPRYLGSDADSASHKRARWLPARSPYQPSTH